MRNFRLQLVLAALGLLLLALAGAACAAPVPPQSPAAVVPVETGVAPLSLPAGGMVWIPLPTNTAPTEPAPVVTIAGVIVDDASGHPVAASARVVDQDSVEHIVRQVNQFQVTMPAASAVTISVTAPGYELWSVRVEPHVRHSAELVLPVRLLLAPAEPADPGAGQSTQPVAPVLPVASADM